VVGDDSALRARNDFGGSLLLLGLLLLESLCPGPKGLRVPLLVVGLYLGGVLDCNSSICCSYLSLREGVDD
jgi:hypothetical protein